MLLKGSRIGEGFPSLLQYIEFHSPVISYMYFLVMGMTEYIPIYVASVRFVTVVLLHLFEGEYNEYRQVHYAYSYRYSLQCVDFHV
jgi:hypothetical protein